MGAAFGLAATFWIILPVWALAYLDTRKSGFFTQKRVGKGGLIFKVVKIRTMRDVPGIRSTITTKGDQRITKLGQFWRRTKIDELPQLINVLKGEMSFVGPRPDVPGYADVLKGDERLLLSVRPGITGPATLKYRDEETLLARQNDPVGYNNDILWPDKMRLNLEYLENWSFWSDLAFIGKTLLPTKGEQAKGPL